MLGAGASSCELLHQLRSEVSDLLADCPLHRTDLSTWQAYGFPKAQRLEGTTQACFDAIGAGPSRASHCEAHQFVILPIRQRYLTRENAPFVTRTRCLTDLSRHPFVHAHRAHSPHTNTSSSIGKRRLDSSKS